KYQVAKKIHSFESAALVWIKHYSQALIDLVIPLYVKYGIALEAHLQNAIATFGDDGLLDMLYIRDFEGLRIDTSHLNKMGFSTADFHEKSLILTNQSQTVFNKVFYSSIQNHLGELIASIAQPSNHKHLENLIFLILPALLSSDLFDIAITIYDQQRINQIYEIQFTLKMDYICVTTLC